MRSARGVLVGVACVGVVAGAVGAAALVRDHGRSAPTPRVLGARPLVTAHPTGPVGVTGEESALPSGVAAIAPSGPPSGPGPEPQIPRTKLFARTTNGNLTILASRADTTSTITRPPWWTPPAACFPTGFVEADLSHGSFAATSEGDVYASPARADVSGTAAIVGSDDQHRVWVVIAQVPADTASVTATFPSGASDAMAPVHGIAVLASAAGTNDQHAAVTVAAIDNDGTVLGSAQMGASAEPPYPAGVTGSDCVPPSQLPPPGAQQPADPAAAEQAIATVVANVWSPDETEAEEFANFDDSHGFDQTQQELRSGPEAAEANSAVSAQADAVVFLSPIQAAIRFTFTIAHFGNFPGYLGEANLENGVWKLTRSTYCNALLTTNARCRA